MPNSKLSERAADCREAAVDGRLLAPDRQPASGGAKTVRTLRRCLRQKDQHEVQGGCPELGQEDLGTPK